MESRMASVAQRSRERKEGIEDLGGERIRILLISTLIMTLVALSVGVVVMYQLYQTAFEQQRVRLVEIVESRARIIEAIARFDAQYSAEDVPGGAWAATLSQIEYAHERFSGLGQTGEFTIARREGDQIVFLLSQRHDPEIRQSMPFDPFESALAAPMRRALSGESGTVVGLDYRGAMVLAAHEPLAGLDVGLVAKIDLAEIRAPFIKAALVSAAIMLAIIALGVVLLLVTVNPLTRRVELRTAALLEAHDQLGKQAGALEQRVSQRTRELEESRAAAVSIRDEAVEARRRLARTAEDLARSNADLEQFAHVASHDLQEPLRMISSYTQLLGRRYRGKLDADADEFIEFASDGAQRMQKLIEDLLNFSRIGSRGRAFDLTETDTVLDQVLESLGTVVEESGAIVHRDGLPTVRADGAQLAHVFQNLISNAIKFHGDGRPEIHVGAKQHDGGWLFWVKDNGIGIESEYAERIFVIFQQLHTQSEYPGTGIGLAVCKRIVERHGGRIWVESQPGEGATFNFTILEESS